MGQIGRIYGNPTSDHISFCGKITYAFTSPITKTTREGMMERSMGREMVYLHVGFMKTTAAYPDNASVPLEESVGAFRLAKIQ